MLCSLSVSLFPPHGLRLDSCGRSSRGAISSNVDNDSRLLGLHGCSLFGQGVLEGLGLGLQFSRPEVQSSPSTSR